MILENKDDDFRGGQRSLSGLRLAEVWRLAQRSRASKDERGGRGVCDAIAYLKIAGGSNTRSMIVGPERDARSVRSVQRATGKREIVRRTRAKEGLVPENKERIEGAVQQIVKRQREGEVSDDLETKKVIVNDGWGAKERKEGWRGKGR